MEKKARLGELEIKEPVNEVLEGVKKIYHDKIIPVEALFKYPNFHTPSMTATDFDAKPMIMLFGQYSTGKTSFIRFMLERDFQGANIGPEPTTDKFMAIMKGNDRIIPGNALAASTDYPFTGLSKFGMGFLNRFEASLVEAPILEKVSFIDTPGILSGKKLERGYQFTEVIRWFVERCQRILVLFDAHKLDISDEFKEAILVTRGNEDKVRCILNKADGLTVQQLIRCYGAMMWSLGKVIIAPEALRVYIGSFWDQPLKSLELAKLLNSEQGDLLADLKSLPRNNTVRIINELIKRTRQVKVHCHVIAAMSKDFGIFGKKKKQEKILDNVVKYYEQVQRDLNLPQGDFPRVDRFKPELAKFSIWEFPKLEKKSEKKKMAALDTALSTDIPDLLKLIPSDKASQNDPKEKEFNPFANGAFSPQEAWCITGGLLQKYENQFYGLPLVEGKLKAADARDVLMRAQVEQSVLKAVWNMADCDKDGSLDSEEFAVAMCLVDCWKKGLIGQEMFTRLPMKLVPPSKRDYFDTVPN